MQFDHRPEEQKIAHVGWFAWRADKEGLELELKKCDVVCANCHAIRTKSRSQPNDNKQRENLSRAMKRSMKEVQNRPDVREKKSKSQSIAMKAFHEQRRAAGIPWKGAKKSSGN